MAKNFGGFPGGGNMNNLMKQAQKLQRQMEEASKNLEASEFTVTSGGGAVTVVIAGTRELKSLTIDPDLVDPDDVETLQDTVLAAVNEAIRKVDAESQAVMGRYTGGMPGGFGF